MAGSGFCAEMDRSRERQQVKTPGNIGPAAEEKRFASPWKHPPAIKRL
ncbi:hypothetical protein B4135_0310 [Caldibacillus debilis]|uniref:Uncharacterized protein n=1 Tax=Caldibacillus debilis TaxID=301148 RepID=A0A150M4V5_9BACI|nr:hypothetical protein B4135_0310 [Caldibacillus debilis]